MWYYLHILKASLGLPKKAVNSYKPETGVALKHSTMYLHPIRKSIGSFDPMSPPGSIAGHLNNFGTRVGTIVIQMCQLTNPEVYVIVNSDLRSQTLCVSLKMQL